MKKTQGWGSVPARNQRGPRRKGAGAAWPEGGRELCVLEYVALVGDGAGVLWQPAGRVPGAERAGDLASVQVSKLGLAWDLDKCLAPQVRSAGWTPAGQVGELGPGARGAETEPKERASWPA